jgi:uncharacterized protein (DUF1697 family)
VSAKARIVALLRGVNVGGRRKIAMAELCRACGEAGLEDVRSYIASGNLVFTSSKDPDDAAAVVERAIARRFGLDDVDVMARTAAQWARCVAANPFTEASAAEPSRVFLLLAKTPRVAATRAEELRERAAPGEAVAVAGGAVWIHWPRTAPRSRLLATGIVDRVVGAPVTARNWRTAVALRDLARASP